MAHQNWVYVVAVTETDYHTRNTFQRIIGVYTDEKTAEQVKNQEALHHRLAHVTQTTIDDTEQADQKKDDVSFNSREPWKELEANARRITACVNFCAGIPLDVLMRRDPQIGTYDADNNCSVPLVPHGVKPDWSKR